MVLRPRVGPGPLLALALLGALFAAPPAAAQESARWLAPHNAERRRVGSPELVWDPALADLARDWARQLLARGALQHRPDTRRVPACREGGMGCGENLAWAMDSRGLPPDIPGAAVAQWISERPDFSPATDECLDGRVCGHYTQVISQWSTRVGCATASTDTEYFAVCNYSPMGNISEGRGYRDLVPDRPVPQETRPTPPPPPLPTPPVAPPVRKRRPPRGLPAAGVEVRPGEHYQVDGRCATVERVVGTQVYWTWRRGGAWANGNLPARDLGPRCRPDEEPRPAPPPRLPRPADVKAGPLWNQRHAEQRCPEVCAPYGGWSGRWVTTVPGTMSVCGCNDVPAGAGR